MRPGLTVGPQLWVLPKAGLATLPWLFSVNATLLVLYGLHISFSFADVSDPPTTCRSEAQRAPATLQARSVCLLPLSCFPTGLTGVEASTQGCSEKASRPGVQCAGLLLPTLQAQLLTSRTRQLWELRSRWMMFMEWR